MSDGAKQLRATAKEIRQAESRVRRAVSPTVTKAAQNIKRDARKNLGRSAYNPWLAIAMSYDLANAGQTGLSAEVGPDQSISGLGLGREFGSSGTPPHPFLFPAADVEEPRFFAAVEAAIAKVYEL